MKAKVRVKGAKNLLKNLALYRTRFTQAEKNAVEAGGKYLYGLIEKEMSHNAPYTGSPYSRIQHPRGIEKGLIAPLKEFAIRKRTGKLLSALTGTLQKGFFGFEYFVGMDESKMPYYGVFVFNGTRVMHPRDPITAMYTDPKVQKKILEIIANELKKA